ncbi:acyl CoA:acetate/3-ketoacid CoA transferase [Paraburkholderia sp. HD33-4]|uniref:acyl CoA:acetate/3-ketoacid CoA transferase n=1 Tax=Paraburkholderia sp. HD33-4 TaxID=2883242 RepID=UPI001F2EE692|nr:CoA-transferase [Paraburkholderia sp. HD33-4]
MAQWKNLHEAVADIPDGATIAITGSGGGLLEADAVLAALEERFLRTGHPRNLTLVHSLGIGDGNGSGVGRFAHPGLVKRVIGGHWRWSSVMQDLAKNEEIEAYSFPAGVIATLFREIGAGRPGVITRVGLRTFVDPRFGGGKINRSATEELVEVIELDGEEFLRFKPFKIDFAIVKASSSDSKGNLTVRHEPADLDIYAVCLAAHNSGGKVIAQVKTMTQGHVAARLVCVPGIVVDTLVEVPSQQQCAITEYDPTLSGELLSTEGRGEFEAPEGIRRIVAERAAREMKAGQSVNFGFGFPGAVPAILADQNLHGRYWGTVEQGIHNGDMLDGVMFGAARNADAIIPSVEQFDFYSGGGIDVTFLGMGELDQEGNVNVSKLNGTVVGPGGFMDITRGSKKIVFCGAFETKGLQVDIGHTGDLQIKNPGLVPKLVDKVAHITFSGAQALHEGKEVLYITERAVFRLSERGVHLVEAATGVDVQRDILDRMGFAPILDEQIAATVSQ